MGSIAKINPPVLPRVYLRKRLFHELDEAQRHPGIWISAPAGSGKTTLVASYLKSRKLPTFWYQIDAGDSDIASFFYYLKLTCEQASPDKPKPLPLLTPEYLAGLETFARNFFRQLFLCIPSGVLVFDNYQLIQEQTEFNRIFRIALENLPKELNILVISRQPPPSLFAPLQVSKQLTHIDSTVLCLDMSEVSGIAQLHCGQQKTLSKEQVQTLYEASEGWTAGVVLLVEQNHFDDLQDMRPGEQTGQHLFNYFAGVIFVQLDQEYQTVLLNTAFLPRFTPSMASTISGTKDTDTILKNLAQKNYFTTATRSGTDIVYQYHHLFQDFLAAKANETLSSTQLEILKEQSAELLLHTNEVSAAANLLVELKHWPGLSDLITSHAKRYIQQGRHLTVVRWLDALPEEIRANKPWLTYWYGAATMPFDLNHARTLFEEAFQGFKQHNDIEGQFLSWSYIVDIIAFAWLDFTPLNKLIDIAEDSLLDKFSSLPNGEVRARFIYGMFTSLMFIRPQHPDIDLWAKRLYELVQSTPDFDQRVYLGSHLAIYYLMWIGDTARASLVHDTITPESPDQLTVPARVIWYVTNATYNWRSNDTSTAFATVNTGLSLTHDKGIQLWDFLLNASGIYASFCNNDIKNGEVYLRQAEPIARSKGGLEQGHYQAMAAWHCLLTGENEQALLRSKESLEISIACGGPLQCALSYLQVSDAHHACGHYDQSAIAIEHVYEIAIAMHSYILRFLTHLFQAHLSLEHGNKASGLHHLHKAFALGKQHRYFNFAMYRLDVMTQLCVVALEHNIEVDYTCDFIRAHRITPDPAPLHLDNWPWPIKIFTLGRFTIEKNGQAVHFTSKGQRKPIELLKILIAMGGKDIPEERLSDLLWPDTDGDAAHSNYTTTVSRLRKLIGAEAVVVEQGQISLDSNHVWLDTWAIEQLINHAKQTQDLEQSAENHILKLYQGSFLEHDGNLPWLLAQRDRLHHKVSHFLSESGKPLVD